MIKNHIVTEESIKNEPSTSRSGFRSHDISALQVNDRHECINTKVYKSFSTLGVSTYEYVITTSDMDGYVSEYNAKDRIKSVSITLTDEHIDEIIEALTAIRAAKPVAFK